MGYWNRLGLVRKDKRNAFQKAYLYVRTNDDIEKIEFSFSTISDDTLTATESTMPMGYDKRTKGIFTYDYLLPFVNNARVEFLDGTTMYVSSIVSVIDEEKAQADGQGVVGLNIYFGG